jgi:hypothetical protein
MAIVRFGAVQSVIFQKTYLKCAGYEIMTYSTHSAFSLESQPHEAIVRAAVIFAFLQIVVEIIYATHVTDDEAITRQKLFAGRDLV